MTFANPNTFTSGFLIGDPVHTNNAGTDSLPVPTIVAGSPASSVLELQSTTGAILLSRMTDLQKAAINAANGMILYDTTSNSFQFYENGAWVGIPAVVGATVVNDLPIFTNTTGTMADSGVKLLFNNGNDNLFQGAASGNGAVAGTNDISFGIAVLNSLTTGSRDFSFGIQSGNGLTTGSDDISIGYHALQISTVSNRCLAIGNSSMASLNDLVNASDNIAIGHNSAAIATAIETSALLGNFTASHAGTLVDCTFLGYNVASAGTGNLVSLTGVGAYALSNVTTNASHLTAVGWESMFDATTAIRCTAVGYQSLNAITVSATGADSTAVGDQSLVLATTALTTTAIGSGAAATQTQYTGCTLIGYQADTSANNLTNATAIGTQATVGVSNACVIGAANSGTKLGIGVQSPNAQLHVNFIAGGGGIILPYRTTNLNAVNITYDDYLVISTAATVAFTLPVADMNHIGQVFIIKKQNGSGGVTNSVAIETQGGQSFEGSNTPTIYEGGWVSIMIYTDGANWFRLVD